MIYLPDSNVCITAMRNRNANVVHKLRTTPAADIALCDVVKAELWYGAYRSGRFEINEAILETFFTPYVSLSFDEKAAKIFGRIRRELELVGTPIGPYDLLIAAIALANNLTLVTHNTREFSRIPALALEDWEI